MLLNRLQKIITGRESYSVAKNLKGSKIIVETKLDDGQRILWSKVFPREEDYLIQNVGPDNQITSEKIEDDNMKPRLFIWYVSKHDQVKRHMELIENSFDRLEITSFENFSTHLIRKQVLIEPSGNSLMKVYTKDIKQLNEEISKKEQPKFYPRLTREQKSITSKLNGSQMVFGRSGTGNIY
jgi:hypothetical protein